MCPSHFQSSFGTYLPYVGLCTFAIAKWSISWEAFTQLCYSMQRSCANTSPLSTKFWITHLQTRLLAHPDPAAPLSSPSHREDARNTTVPPWRFTTRLGAQRRHSTTSLGASRGPSTVARSPTDTPTVGTERSDPCTAPALCNPSPVCWENLSHDLFFPTNTSPCRHTARSPLQAHAFGWALPHHKPV